MKLLTFVACVAGLLAVSTAHLCLVSPRQRGSMMGLDKEGSDDCILTKPPCGGRPISVPETMWTSGGNYTVVFQKNLDHWLKTSPGFFGISLIANGDVQELQRVPDNGEPSLHLYTASGTLPTNMLATTYQLQVTYVPKNPEAPPTFYQCADIMVK